MKKLITMMSVLVIINLTVYITALFISDKIAIPLYRIAILCNITIFILSLNLIYREIRRNTKIDKIKRGFLTKKHIAIGLLILILLITFIGCKNASDTQSRTYGIQPPISELFFGMAKEDVIHLLGDNYTTEVQEDGTELLSYKDLDAYGKKANVEIRLLENLSIDGDGKLFPNLSTQIVDSISFSFQATDTESVLAEIKRQYGTTEQKVWNMENSLAYSREDCVENLENTEWIQKLWEYQAVYVSGEEPASEIPESFLSEPLNSLAVIYNDDGCGIQISSGKLLKLADIMASET